MIDTTEESEVDSEKKDKGQIGREKKGEEGKTRRTVKREKLISGSCY